MPLDPDFIADCPYFPGGLLLDEILTIDAAANLVRVRMPTLEDLPITRDQRVHPTRHPRHVSGGLMVHMTGIAGFVHAYYLLGMRHNDGWTGYGARIYNARFASLGTIGEPIEIECRASQQRKMGDKLFVRYHFKFEQTGRLVYESEQGAMFLKAE